MEELVEEKELELEEEPELEGRAWYVIHSYSGYENKVKANLEQRIESMGMQDKIFQVVVPTEEEIEVRDGQRRITEKYHLSSGTFSMNSLSSHNVRPSRSRARSDDFSRPATRATKVATTSPICGLLRLSSHAATSSGVVDQQTGRASERL